MSQDAYWAPQQQLLGMLCSWVCYADGRNNYGAWYANNVSTVKYDSEKELL